MDFQSMFLVNSSHPDDSDSDSESDEEEEEGEEADSTKVIQELVDKARSNVIPEKSKKLYEKQYIKFQDWKKEMKLGSETTEAHLLAYFQQLSENYAPTTLWATYTKLKAMLSLKEYRDISKFLELRCFLKNKGKKHIPKKAMVFTTHEVSTFLNDASDENFLLHKVGVSFIFYSQILLFEVTRLMVINFIGCTCNRTPWMSTLYGIAQYNYK